MLHLRRPRLLVGGAAATVLAAATLLVAAGPAAAQGGKLVVYAAGGDDAHPCTTALPCKTIGHAISVAAPGSTIVVWPGTYTEEVTVTKRLTLLAYGGAVIDATGLDNGIVISGPGAAGTTVDNFMVENANAEGILAVATWGLNIVDNELLHNDQTPGNADLPQCNPPAPLPPDCGEGLHLNAVSNSQIVGNNIHDNIGGILVTDEAGPSHGNLIEANIARDNKVDCGITLPSHNPLAVSDPSRGGVYDNTIIGNLSEGNGGAGVGMFAPGPGMGSYDNFVYGNQLLNNGEAGVAIHGHAPGQKLSGNVIIGNTISGNGVDPDADSGQPVGIAFLNADPLDTVDVLAMGNTITNEYWGVFTNGLFWLRGFGSSANTFSSVTVPIGRHA